jgi:acyl dehydratase
LTTEPPIRVAFALLPNSLVLDWAGPGAELTALSFRFKGFVFAGETVRCTGRVSSVEDGLTSLECQVDVVGDDARVAVAPAAAEVRLP